MTELWRDRLGGYALLVERFGAETVVAETGARFRGAARFDELIEFTVAITRIGESSLRSEITATRGADLLVEGFLEYVFVDLAEMRPVTIPDEIRDALINQRNN